MALNSAPPNLEPRELGLGQALKSFPGESLCGDQCGWWLQPNRLRLALADGLGHGPEAHKAAEAVIHQIATTPGQGLPETFADCDRALIGTRGVALSVVDVPFGTEAILHAAVGNIRTLLLQDGHIRRLGGARGIVGAGYSGLHPERFSLRPGDWLVIFSDGIPEDADIAASLIENRPSNALAEQLLVQWASDRDDAGILIYQHE
ncbi:Stage II sporulation protein E [Thiorhodococcus drewsii AZ1]|uniref:Stage II sporulation protein E n=1 Tax=Thiorhodococcus drewsii AZ1 TaxID=765913 RepID=G2E0H4_9GAMM|nr:SpoIIE family protein phosphatase [Thiorhodococcus drewsii]EGV31902.1 Stage II sporulation protein E [Thiorhodococcus drewsii AZ1]